MDTGIAIERGRVGMWPEGAAWLDGRFMPLAEAKIPVTDWGYRRSDVTYDVTSVWDGAFFRLADHLARFRRSREALRLKPPEDDATLRAILHELVRRTGLRRAYVAMDCLRTRPARGLPLNPVHGRAYLLAFVTPYVWVFSEEQQARGVHAIVAKTPRVPPESIDPTVKNFNWGDLTRALFEAADAGADTAILLDRDGFVTEGPGYNVFAIRGGTVVSPDSGALEGITRRSVFELCAELGIPCEARRLPVEELREADEILFATTAGGGHAGLPARRPDLRQRPAGADLGRPARALLGAARGGVARRAGRLRGGLSRRPPPAGGPGKYFMHKVISGPGGRRRGRARPAPAPGGPPAPLPPPRLAPRPGEG